MIRWASRSGIDGIERTHDVSHLRETFGTRPRSARSASPIAHLVAAAVFACGFGLVGPEPKAQVSVEPGTVTAYTFTLQRIVASGAAITALIGVLIAGLALARSAGRIGTDNARRGAIVALVLGPIGLGIGGLVVATADGGLGTGNGLGGGIVAMMLGLIGIGLGGLALVRSRRTA